MYFAYRCLIHAAEYKVMVHSLYREKTCTQCTCIILCIAMCVCIMMTEREIMRNRWVQRVDGGRKEE